MFDGWALFTQYSMGDFQGLRETEGMMDGRRFTSLHC
jgi:hypothetical protein